MSTTKSRLQKLARQLIPASAPEIRVIFCEEGRYYLHTPDLKTHEIPAAEFEAMRNAPEHTIILIFDSGEKPPQSSGDIIIDWDGIE